MKKFLKALPAIIFSLFIALMLILFIALPKASYSETEKRYLAQAPKFTFDSFFSGKFGEEFETYLCDHTAFRTTWVGLNAYYNLAVGNNGADGIYHCNNGYLINDPCDSSKLHSNIEVIKEFADKISTDTTVLIAPSTGYICSDVLPKNHREYHDDELFTDMESTLSSSAHFVDVREAFKKEYQDGKQIYYKTDHHWTSEGAYTAYKELSKELSYTPIDKSEYEITSYDGFYGTTYSSSGFWYTKPDTLEVWDNKANDGHIHIEIQDGADTIESDDMFFYSHLNESDMYPVFSDGNHPYTKITNNSKDASGKLLIIKDSFAHSFAPFVADHFEETVMLDMRYYKQSVSKFVEQENFDKVLVLYSIDNLATDTDIAWLE